MKSKAIEYTEQLISIPSVSGNEQACLQFIYDWMIKIGLEEVAMTSDYVAGCKKGQDSTKAMLLAGHIDTVSAGELASWQTKPWKPTLVGDKLFGLGGTDMKGGIAAQMAALEATDDVSQDTWLVVTSNEEIDGSGTAAFAAYFAKKDHYKRASCVIAEPTGLEKIEIGHRGNAFVRLTFHGQAGHGSQQKSFVISGLAKATKFLAKIPKIAEALSDNYADELFGVPTFVPTGMQAGSADSPNKTSDEATVIVDIRTTPDLDVVLADMLAKLGNQYGFGWEYAAKPVKSCQCDQSSAIISKLKHVSGVSSVGLSHGATDQVFFEEIGVDTVVFGPGEFAQAHTQNEWVSCEKIENATELYARLIVS